MAHSLRSPAPMQTSISIVNLNNPEKLAFLAYKKACVSFTIRLLLAAIKEANGVAWCSDGTLKRRLANLIKHKVPACAVIDRRGVSSKDIVVDAQTGVWIRIFSQSMDKGGNGMAKTEASDSAKRKKRRIIFYIHKGGFSVMFTDGIMYNHFLLNFVAERRLL